MLVYQRVFGWNNVAKQCHVYHPSVISIDRWYLYHCQSWLVYDNVLPTLCHDISTTWWRLIIMFFN